MKPLKPLLYLSLVFSPFGVMGQSHDSSIVKALKSPQAPANSAKADVYVQDKKIVAIPAPKATGGKKRCKRNPTK